MESAARAVSNLHLTKFESEYRNSGFRQVYLIGRTTIYVSNKPEKSMRELLIISLVLFSLPGCTTPVVDDVDIVQGENDEVLQGVNVVSKTLGREIDKTSNYNLLQQSGNDSTLILWAAAGCNGCHQWTEMIRECMENGTIDEEANVVTIHRYPGFESQYVFDTYGNNSSNQYSPWPALVPQRQILFGMLQQESKLDSPSEAFSNSVTPTLQVRTPWYHCLPKLTIQITSHGRRSGHEKRLSNQERGDC